jgi:uncharacterized protein
VSAPSSSASNKALIQSLYDAFARGDVMTVLAALSPDVQWNEAENFLYADGNPYVGPNAVLEGVFMRLGTEWDGFGCDPIEYLEENDKVACFGRYKGTHKSTGRPLNAQYVHVWTVRDGQAIAFQQYTDTAQFQQIAGV